jgi:hypothetical protein
VDYSNSYGEIGRYDQKARVNNSEGNCSKSGGWPVEVIVFSAAGV